MWTTPWAPASWHGSARRWCTRVVITARQRATTDAAAFEKNHVAFNIWRDEVAEGGEVVAEPTPPASTATPRVPPPTSRNLRKNMDAYFSRTRRIPRRHGGGVERPHGQGGAPLHEKLLADSKAARQFLDATADALDRVLAMASATAKERERGGYGDRGRRAQRTVAAGTVGSMVIGLLVGLLAGAFDLATAARAVNVLGRRGGGRPHAATGSRPRR